MIKYILFFVIFLMIFLVISHNINNKRINTELKIQQTEHPDANMISLLQNNKLPTIFLYELELWDGFDLLVGEEYEIIKEVLDNKDAFNKLHYYLKPFNLPMKSRWDIKLNKTATIWEELPNKPLREDSYNHLICNFSGLMMLCLFNPSKENIELLENEENIKEIISSEEEIKKTGIEYIIVPIRPCNMIYIPFGWYYWLYNGTADKYCCYLNCNNK